MMLAVVSERTWARFWDDRQAVRLKVLLLVMCILAAAALEAPW
ncbi:MAG: hypothetical protein QME77_07190 [bacterium]|nr:hypothetical protein [bacterium]